MFSYGYPKFSDLIGCLFACSFTTDINTGKYNDLAAVYMVR